MSDSTPLAGQKLILASASPRRLALLQQIGIDPHALLPVDLDETPGRNEAPRVLASRLAVEKAERAATVVSRREDLQGSFILAADTVVAVGRRILPKCETRDDVVGCLRLLSGRSHRVFTGIALITPRQRRRARLVETRVRFKRLSTVEIAAYIETGEWKGKAGGYAIQGIASALVVRLVGSHSAVIGLPLYESAALLEGEGFAISKRWINSAAGALA